MSESGNKRLQQTQAQVDEVGLSFSLLQLSGVFEAHRNGRRLRNYTPFDLKIRTELRKEAQSLFGVAGGGHNEGERGEGPRAGPEARLTRRPRRYFRQFLFVLMFVEESRL